MKPLHEILNWKLVKTGHLEPIKDCDEELEEIISEREQRWKDEDWRGEESFDHWHNNQ